MNDLEKFRKDSEEELLQAERGALDKVVWRKLDRWVLPLCTCFVVLDALNKANISNARVAGLKNALSLSDYQYTLALTATYIAFVVAEFPSTLALKCVGPNLWLPGLVTLSGVVAASQGDQGTVKTYHELFICRFFLGLVEGGVVPGITLYLSIFYPRKRLQIRIAIFHASLSLSGALSGSLASVIERMDGMGGFPGWAWIFILEGILAVVVGGISFFFLPRSPEMVPFLTEQERECVMSALKRTGSVSENDESDNFSWSEVANSVKSLHMWLVAGVFFLSGAMMSGLALQVFEPSIVAGLGYAGNRAQLMSVPPYATAFVLTLIGAFVSDCYQCRGYISIFFALLELIGFSMFYACKSNHVRYASLFFIIPGVSGVAPTATTWLVNNSAPYTRRATGLAVGFVVSELRGILATWLLGFVSRSPNYTAVVIMFIIMSIGTLVFSAANLVYLSRENRLKAEKRRGMRKEDEPGDLGDRSAWFIYSL